MVVLQAGERSIAVIADEDEGALHMVDLASMSTLAVTETPEAPTGVVALDDGRVAVSYRWANRVAIWEVAASVEKGLEPRCDRLVAAEPVALASAGDALYVVAGLGRRLSRLRAADLRQGGLTVSLDQAPRGLALSEDAKTAFVSYLAAGHVDAVPLDRTDGDVASVALTMEEVPRFFFEESKAPKPLGQGFALAVTRPFAEGEETLFVPAVRVDTGVDREPVSSGYGAAVEEEPPLAPTVVTIDARRRERLSEVVGARARSNRVACTLPRAAVARGARLYLACAGIDAVLELDARVPDPLLVEHRRFPVGGGPEGLALTGDRLLAWSRFDRELARIDLVNGDQRTMVLPVREATRIDPIFARGRRIFHDTHDLRVSGDGRACASCHPDGLDDGLVWSSPDGPRQTRRLSGLLQGTAPYGWFGRHEDLRAHLGATIERLGGVGFRDARDQEDLAALIHYIERLPTPREGARAEDEEGALLARGKALFDSSEQGCGMCHDGGGTDGAPHDVGSARRLVKFDTPSLRFIGESAPYYHDGRFASLEQLLAATDGAMGHTGSLGAEDLRALTHYLRSL
ncbi:MAG: c-type cytochrome [Polyangiaceae bacterium]